MTSYVEIDGVLVVSFDNGKSYYVRRDNNEVYQTDNFGEAMQIAEVIAFNNYAATWSE
jgi:hypothetical protein